LRAVARAAAALRVVMAEARAAALRVAAARLRSAADADEVRGALLEAAAALATGAAPTGCACETLYARFLDTLLARVLPGWVPCMSTGQRQACFDVWFDGTLVPLHFALLALGRALGADADADAGVVELLRLLLWGADRTAGAGDPARGMVRVLELAEVALNADAGRAAAGEAVLGLIVSLPERVANALKLEAPRWAAPERFHAAVAGAAWQLLSQQLAAPLDGARIIPVLLSRQARLRQAGSVMQVWVPRLLASAGAQGSDRLRESSDQIGNTALAATRSVLEALPDPAFEQAVRAILVCLPPFDHSSAVSVARKLLHEILCPGLQGMHAWRYLLSQKLPTDQALPRTTQARHSIRYVLDCLLHGDKSRRDDADGGASLVEDALGTIVTVWTDPGFPQQSTIEYHRHLTHSMLYCLKLMVERSNAAHVQQRLERRGWIGELMHGVQGRFDSTIPSVRMLGMLIAERLSELISPDKPLCFDEVAAAKALLSSSTTVDAEVLADVDYFQARGVAPLSSGVIESPATEKTSHERCVTVSELDDLVADDRVGVPAVVELSEIETDDPDAVLAPAYNDESSCDSSEDADADDDDASVASLEAYAVPPAVAQGRRGHRPPKHVREVIAWLRLPKDPAAADYDRYDAALRNIEGLLYSASDSGVSALHDEAKELITLLIHLQDALVDNPSDATGRSFLQLRHDALVATVVRAPAIACLHLASAVYRDNCSVATRLDCLRALEDGSTHLANPSRRRLQLRQHGLAVDTSTIEVASTDSEPTDSKREPMRSEPKTRRWGHTARVARGEQRQQEVAQRNEFADFAGPVTFTLIAGFDDRGGSADYLRTEPVFIAKLLHCLAVVFEAAGHAPGLPRMAERLGELCWQLRHHSEASVRRGVLVVFAQLIMATNLGSSAVHSGDAGEWLREVAMDDSDATCREVAKTCLGACAH
jgi:hypothetical protein